MKCDNCLNARKVISENGLHSVCCLSARVAMNCIMGKKDQRIPTIHCNCTDEEIAKSFIEDVEAVKELLPRAESEGEE